MGHPSCLPPSLPPVCAPLQFHSFPFLVSFVSSCFSLGQSVFYRGHSRPSPTTQLNSTHLTSNLFGESECKRGGRGRLCSASLHCVSLFGRERHTLGELERKNGGLSRVVAGGTQLRRWSSRKGDQAGGATCIHDRANGAIHSCCHHL